MTTISQVTTLSGGSKWCRDCSDKGKSTGAYTWYNASS